ncbi:MAG TPA: hypothetical protein VEZ14_11165 [Dehalococcoidia bacterium]|nr:hypothetical protein [Dehalococcoidia bacterium]
MSVTILNTHADVRTQGLSRRIGYEVCLGVTTDDERRGAQELVAFVADYVARQRARLMPEETMEYGIWLVKFRESTPGLLDVWEMAADGDEFRSGASNAIRAWREQRDVCDKCAAAFSPPHPSQLVSISAGVREGDAVDGVRYPSPRHMSGWWLSTDRYDGDVRTMMVEHIYHVAIRRPDLVCFLALPPGWRFSTLSHGKAWFDEGAAREPS